MKTNLVIFFSSEGADPKEVGEKIAAIGFEAIAGERDFVHTWEKEPSTDDMLDLGSKVKNALSGTNTFFKLETVN